MKSSCFNKRIKENTTGSVRQILSFDNLSQIKVPVPSLPQQQAAVSKFNSAILKAEQAEQNVFGLEKSVDDILFNELGIKIKDETLFYLIFYLAIFENGDMIKYQINSITIQKNTQMYLSVI